MTGRGWSWSLARRRAVRAPAAGPGADPDPRRDPDGARDAVRRARRERLRQHRRRDQRRASRTGCSSAGAWLPRRVAGSPSASPSPRTGGSRAWRARITTPRCARSMFGLAGLNLAVRGRITRWPPGSSSGLRPDAACRSGLAFPAFAALYAYRPADGWRLRRRTRLAARSASAIVAHRACGLQRRALRLAARLRLRPHPVGRGRGLITDEPWFSEGLLSLSYIPRHLQVIFLDGFHWVDEAPFLQSVVVRQPRSVLTAPFLFLARSWPAGEWSRGSG